MIDAKPHRWVCERVTASLTLRKLLKMNSDLPIPPMIVESLAYMRTML